MSYEREKQSNNQFMKYVTLNHSGRKIIYLTAKPNSGKTSTIQELRKILISNNLPETILNPTKKNQKDFVATYLYNGKTIGLSSVGDPSSCHQPWLNMLTNANCDIIICACRTSGATLNRITSLSNYESYGFVPNHNAQANNTHNANLLYNTMLYLL